ncbi:MAG: hypothetical protein OXJ37_16480 [Bryobacterales bacterium]|nr:hypothetical protein [Bryobacterales bacterium]MDE0622102.1 hypothetical protein [Bryobacterales bacterium]
MQFHRERIRRAQELMKRHEMIGLMFMNHDDYRYFFGDTRSQPRAIIPAVGSPVFIGFAGEEADLRRELRGESFKLFSHVGEQISNVRKTFLEPYGGPPPGVKLPSTGRARIGMQMWFQQSESVIIPSKRRILGGARALAYMGLGIITGCSRRPGPYHRGGTGPQSPA